MTGRFDNIHPGLSQQEAIRLLRLPVDQLESQSDPYMAASHLINYPGQESEEALLSLVSDPSTASPRRLARRKAVEVLARLNCQSAIDPIGTCLESDDIYLVENSAWALLQLKCNEQSLLKRMQDLLCDPAQNRRVLIQSLAGLGVVSALPTIESLKASDVPGERGAAISASIRLGGARNDLRELEDHLLLPNQMDRQSAIQDCIDCQAVELLPQILIAPVSPVFRMRALRSLSSDASALDSDFSLTDSLDALLYDSPDSINLVHRYDDSPSNDFLIQELFGTDFSRCYLALQALKERPSEQLWPLMETRWFEEAFNDYGAHYFFIRLLGSISTWPEIAHPHIDTILRDAISSDKPQFMKSKPAAILSSFSFRSKEALLNAGIWICPERTTFWECRYAVLMALDKYASKEDVTKLIREAQSDPHPFVARRAELMNKQS